MLDLKIGFRCNNNCIHCVVANKRSTKDLEINLIKDLIKNSQEPEIVFTGGEPSLYSYLPDLLKYASEEGHICWIQTNGTGFADRELAERCAPYIFNAHVAIHSYRPEVHNSIVQDKTGTMWEKTIQGFRNLKELGVPCMTTQTVVTRLNMETVYDTFRWIQEQWPGTHMSFTYPHMMGNALKNAHEVCFKYSEYKEEMHRIFRDFHELLFIESVPFCYQHPYVDQLKSAEKDLLSNFCSNKIGYDFSGGSHLKNYRDLDLRERRKAIRCLECIYFKECPGVWKEYIDLNYDILDLFPIKEFTNGDTGSTD